LNKFSKVIAAKLTVYTYYPAFGGNITSNPGLCHENNENTSSRCSRYPNSQFWPLGSRRAARLCNDKVCADKAQDIT